MADVAPFTGFGPDALDFLDGLAADNSKSYFGANRAVYDHQVAGPMKSLVVAVGDGLRERVSPAVEAEPKVGKSLFRINRDLRFSKDKTPYNPYVDAVFWEGSLPRTSPGFILRIGADALVVGAGVFGLSGDRLARYRDAVVDDATGAELEATIGASRRAVKGATLSEPQRKRVPAGYPSDHSRADLLCFDGLHLSVETTPPASITSARFVPWLLDRYEKLAPFEQWLVRNVGD
ncbi:MAG: DUF2461 domain-containing protein [Ilumatobacteraceae bacterium]